MKFFYLLPVDGRKSFYNKCKVVQAGNNATLYSYDTPVCTYNTESKSFIKLNGWNYSSTTKRHQKAFLDYYDIEEV